MEYKGYTLQQACDEVVFHNLADIKGEGGLIAVDKEGNHAMVFNSAGMYRAYRNSEGSCEIAIYS
jgi:beta-aspartyl-peptidase (threonine type)